MFVFGENLFPDRHVAAPEILIDIVEERHLWPGEQVGYFRIVLGDVPAKVEFEFRELVSTGKLPDVVYACQEAISSGAIPVDLFMFFAVGVSDGGDGVEAACCQHGAYHEGRVLESRVWGEEDAVFLQHFPLVDKAVKAVFVLVIRVVDKAFGFQNRGLLGAAVILDEAGG